MTSKVNVLSHALTYRKHLLQTVFRWRRNTQHAEVSDKSRRDRVSTATRGRTCCTDRHVLRQKQISNGNVTECIRECCSLHIPYAATTTYKT